MKNRDSLDALDFYMGKEEYYQKLYNEERYSEMPMSILLIFMRRSNEEFKQAISKKIYHEAAEKVYKNLKGKND